MRDRLIEIINNCVKQPIMIEGLELWADSIADYLIENGVVVSPCKVGQMVYVMENEFTGFWECQIISMQYDGVQWLGYMNCLWVHHHGGFWKWQECDIGKTAFLSREQAEKALAEVANGK